MLRIAIQSKGRLYEESMALLEEAGIKIPGGKRTLLVPARNFPVEVLFLRDDDIPESVASGVADVGIVGLNEVMEKRCPVGVLKKLGFGKCRLSLAIPQDIDYQDRNWFSGKKIATSYPGILSDYLHKNGIVSDIHVITGSVEIAPGIRLADAIFDIVSSGSTLVSNRLKEVETVVESEAVLIGTDSISPEKRGILDELLFRFDSVQAADDKKYIQVTEAMNAPETRERELSPLQKIPDNYEKLVVCMDTGLQQEQDGIRIVNAIDFLLE